METQYWLAYPGEIDNYGTVCSVELTDGPHKDPEGVVRAHKIIAGIGLDKPNLKYLMVTVGKVPEIEAKVNQESINLLRSLINP